MCVRACVIACVREYVVSYSEFYTILSISPITPTHLDLNVLITSRDDAFSWEARPKWTSMWRRRRRRRRGQFPNPCRPTTQPRRLRHPPRASEQCSVGAYRNDFPSTTSGRSCIASPARYRLSNGSRCGISDPVRQFSIYSLSTCQKEETKVVLFVKRFLFDKSVSTVSSAL